VPRDWGALNRLEKRISPDRGPVWRKRVRAEAMELIRGLDHPVILDLGCGQRSCVPLDLEGRPGLRVGLDLERSFASNPALDSFVVASAESLPLRPACVDVVLSSFLLEHLARPHEALREVARVLKPGGHAILWTSNRLNYAIALSSVTPMRFHNWALRFSFPHGKDRCPTFYRMNTPKALEQAVCASGLRLCGPVRVLSNAHWYFQFSRPLFACFALASRIADYTPLRRFKGLLVVHCEKPQRP
jgi:SAM-dependent methyltransferase